jgi:hypothetical protein
MTIGYVTVDLIDNGGSSIVVPGNAVMLLMGVCSGGVANQIVATLSPSTLVANLGYGPLVEAAALVCNAGGTAVCMKLAPNTHGAATAVTPGAGNTSTSSLTLTLDSTNGAFDSLFVTIQVILGGTIATGPAQVRYSQDAGRNWSPTINLGTATTLVLPQTGITVTFGTGNLVTGDTFTFTTTEPLFNDSAVQSALNIFAGSVYGTQGVGLFFLVGGTTAPTTIGIPGCSGADATTFSGYLTTLRNNPQPVYMDCLLSAMDASPPTAWGGSGQSESAWITALETSFSATAASFGEVSAVASYYNMPSAIPIAKYGFTPSPRRSLAWALACRQVTVQPQRSWARVKSGNLTQIVVNPSVDPTDGFIYHNEAINPGLSNNVVRLQAATTRAYKQGIFLHIPWTMAATGSQFAFRYFAAVANVAAVIAQQIGGDEISDDLRTIPTTGALDPRDASTFQAAMNAALATNMTQQSMCTSVFAVVDTSSNVESTNNVNVSITINGKAYALTVTIGIQYSSPSQAA